MVVEGVIEENDRVARAVRPESRAESAARKPGQRALFCDARNTLAETRNEIRQTRNPRRERRPLPDAAHRPGLPRAPVLLVVMRHELGLVRGHVGVRWAVAAATLAAEAPVERVFHFLALPAVGDELAAQHLSEKPRAAARGVALLARAAVARAHGAAFRGAALPHADATPDGSSETVPLLAGEGKLCLESHGLVLRSEAQVFIHPQDFSFGIDDLPGVHAILRVPQRLELAEGLHQLRAEHERQELGARMAV